MYYSMIPSISRIPRLLIVIFSPTPTPSPRFHISRNMLFLTPLFIATGRPSSSSSPAAPPSPDMPSSFSRSSSSSSAIVLRLGFTSELFVSSLACIKTSERVQSQGRKLVTSVLSVRRQVALILKFVLKLVLRWRGHEDPTLFGLEYSSRPQLYL